MKLSKEERIDLKTGINKFLLLFILLSDVIIPQITFKGFCKLTSFEVDSGYTKIFSFNFNQDEYSDLLIYNPTEKKAKLYEGKPGLKFDLKKELSFPLQPSRIEPIRFNNNMIEAFAFTSRKSRSFGIYKFSNQGNPELINQIKFNSYPENISVADFDGDGNPEYLLSGNSFDGLSIIRHKANKLEEQKILQGQLYINAQFIDFNNDGFKDIAALNSIDNTLHFLFNGGHSDFKELRKIDINENVLSLRIFDLNYDSYPDIIVGTSSSIKIFFGDATVSYQKIITVNTASSVNDFVIGDFNRDGFFDFNYLDISDGKVSTIFAKDFYLYSEELIHIKKNGIVSLIPFFSKFVYGSAFINDGGEVSILSKVTSLSDNQSLAIGVSPKEISSFDLLDNGINDLMFIDDYDQSLKFIIRDAAGLPEKLFTANLNENHNKIIAFNNSKTVKTFFCFSVKRRIIESIEINFENFSVRHDYLYAEGPIEDLVVDRDEFGNAEFFILYSDKGSLNFEIFSKAAQRYMIKTSKRISFNWFSPSILSIKDKLVGYWSTDNENISYNLADIKTTDYVINKIFEINRRDFSIVSGSNSVNNIQDLSLYSLVSSKDGMYLLQGIGNIKVYAEKSNKYGLRITDRNQLFFGKSNSIFVNDNKAHSFYNMVPDNSKNNLMIKEIFTDIDISNFIVVNLDQRNNHLIYTNGSHLISIKQLP